MKIALITDLHWGARNDSQVFIDYYDQFYTNVFFPTLERERIDTVIILGDVFDRRKYINFPTLDASKNIFFDKLNQKRIKTYVLVGNHDAPYKNTIRPNSVDLLLGHYDNVEVINHPREIEVGKHGVKLCMLPWLCQDNMEDALQLIKSTKAGLCFGHLEISGFAMYKGMESHEGMEKSIFDRFELVFSGHYHHRSSNGNIHYLGNPYELTWQDYNDPRGFHLLETTSRELTFIENPYKMFHKVHYDDSSWQSTADVESINCEAFKNTHVKIVVRTKNNPLWFDLLIERIEAAGVADIQVVDDHLHLDLEDDTEILDQAEDTLTILKKYTESINTQTDKQRLDSLLQSLYSEALSLT